MALSLSFRVNLEIRGFAIHLMSREPGQSSFFANVLSSI
jgi:hypothetical protein